MPGEYTAHVQATGMQLLVARPRGWDRSAQFSIRALFSLSTRQSRYANDIDNLLKTLLDAGNKVLWNDDRQVIECYMRKLQHAQDPGITLTVSPVG